MKDYQDRVQAEQKELQNKINKLQLFVESFPLTYVLEEEAILLRQQLEAMILYNNVLLRRISIYYQNS